MLVSLFPSAVEAALAVCISTVLHARCRARAIFSFGAMHDEMPQANLSTGLKVDRETVAAQRLAAVSMATQCCQTWLAVQLSNNTRVCMPARQMLKSQASIFVLFCV